MFRYIFRRILIMIPTLFVTSALIFTVMLFVLEPFVLRRRLERRAVHDTIVTQRTVLRMHRVLLTASLITIPGAVAGSHGWLIWRG